MRCVCCDTNLSDYESTIKDAHTGKYLDMCKACIKESGVGTMVVIDDRPDLDHEEEVEQEILVL
ncbi:MAG: hypothetical protein WC471_06155 [Candidatus Woesearchaeota archaeon]